MTTLLPWLSVTDAAAAVRFYVEAFGAVVVQQLEHDDVVEVACLQVGGAEFWVQRSDDPVDGSTVRMIMELEEPDVVFEPAVAAGATVLASMHDDHGWRTGRLRDPTGLQWEPARRLHSPDQT